MQIESAEKRRAPRFAIPAPATVRNGAGEQMTGSVVNVSSSGILMALAGPLELAVGDEIMIHVDLPLDPDRPLPSWGLGTVVRTDGTRLAVELFMAGFHPLQEEPPFPTEG